ncbi:MAG: type I DNA topoisomerase [Hyphomicrobiaceae bacterium]|nr:type I DNA topoisomerase [Hyphomicrobiaceae bacterium]
MNVVIVESAAKAKTINKYLGSSYKVIASYGHVRDLPSKDGAVEPDNDFHMHWQVDEERSKKVLREITEAVRKADKLILATDPDREGEAISWHLLQILTEKKALKKDTPVERVAFNAVTKQAILDALAHPRQIDAPLVDAYLARRALDYLVGFNISPVLWRKLPGARSAGRVQSVALRLVCDREAEIEAFRSEEYWSIEADLTTEKREPVRARLQAIAGESVKRLDIKNEASALAIKAAVERQTFTISSVDKKAVRRNPFAPFTTSTLQQEASRKLGFSAKQTMNVAQRLYEGVDIGGETVGLITYMRTDGVSIVPEAVAEIRRHIESAFSKRYVAPFIREYKSKAKNAQEAHEAIRPTDVRRTPDRMAKVLQADQARLYDLIWKRAVASQMASAELEQTTADMAVPGRDGKAYTFRATGSIVVFEGFLKLYQETRDDPLPGADDEDDSARRLPPLSANDRLTNTAVDAKQHFTEPPPRYSEATLVKRLEELGIGRPSTYASTLATIVDRNYVRIDKKKLIPEANGRLVTAFLKRFFTKYLEYDYTADLEEKLDLISDAKLDYKVVLREFWEEFTAIVGESKELRVSDVLEHLNEILSPLLFPPRDDGTEPRSCPKCKTGRLSLKPSRQGSPFIGCENYPECNYTRQFGQDPNDPTAGMDGRDLGFDPETGLAVVLKTGRFGPYLQLGEAKDKDDKPKRSSIPKGIDAATVDLETALNLLRLPREVGLHPEDGKPIQAGLGRFGPFVLHDGTYANVESIQDVFEIGVNRAVTVLAEKRAGGGKSRFQRGAPKPLRELGEHAGLGAKVNVFEGKYGPYVACDGNNATIPKGKDPSAITLEEAIALIDERIANGGGKKKGKFAKKAPAKKTAGKASGDGDSVAKPAPRRSPAKTAAKKPTLKPAAKSAKPAAKAKL